MVERGYYVSFAGNVTYPKASDLRAAAAQIPADRILAETDSPYLAPQARRGRPNEPANVVLTVSELAKVRGEDAGELSERISANAASASRPREAAGHAEPRAGAALPGRRKHPRRDRPTRGARGRRRGARDRPRPRCPHRLPRPARRARACIELDRSPSLTWPSGSRGARQRRASLRRRAAPRPSRPSNRTWKLVANLPYNVATPIVVESLDGLPSVDLWTVMVQREVADRFFAEPSTKAYGAVSVLIQLAAERTGFHPVSRTVFRPQPNVDSALVAFRRTGLSESYPEVKRVVEAAFAHRRKRCQTHWSFPGSRRGPSRRGAGRDRARAGHSRGGSGPAGVRCAHRGAGVKSVAAHAKINPALVVGPTRADGKHEVATVLQRIDLRIESRSRPQTRSRFTAFRRTPRAQGAVGARRHSEGRHR